MSKVSILGTISCQDGKAEDMEAAQNHGQSEATQEAMQEFEALAAQPPQMTVTTPVAAIGLDI